MRKTRATYTFFQSASAVMMIVALTWLTISTPFVFASQQKIAKQNIAASSEIPSANTEDESANPLGNTTEEKSPGGINSFSEEYLHDNYRSEYLLSITSQFNKSEDASTYIAFHGELLVPPPNMA